MVAVPTLFLTYRDKKPQNASRILVTHSPLFANLYFTTMLKNVSSGTLQIEDTGLKK